MDEEQRDALRRRLRAQLGVVQQRDLHAGAAMALDAVAGARDDQQGLRILGAEAGDVEGQFLSVAAAARLDVRVDGESGAGLQELRACFGKGGGKRIAGIVHRGSWVGIQARRANHFSTSRTHSVAPSGMRSSLKS